MSSRRSWLLVGLAACADPIEYAPADPVPPGDEEADVLSFRPPRVAVQSGPGQVRVVEIELRSDRAMTVDGAAWEGDETWDVRASASFPLRVDGARSIQLELRTGLPVAGGELSFWSENRALARLPVDRWEAPSLELTPEVARGVGVVGSRLRLPLRLRRRAGNGAQIHWRVVADDALVVSPPAPIQLGEDELRELTLFVEATRPGDWALRIGAVAPRMEAWAEAQLHFESAEAWQLEVFADPDRSSALLRDLRAFSAWSENGSAELEGRTQRLVGPVDDSTELWLTYLEDCRSAPSGLLTELFGATLTSLVPGSAEWREVVEEVCAGRGPLDLRWTMEQGGERAEGRAQLERRDDRVRLGRWNAKTRRFEVAP